MLKGGSPDLILTAFECYYGTHDSYLDTRILNSAETPREVAERLLIDAAKGEGVIYNLRELEKVENDDYTKMIIALSYAFAGDYENAARVYSTCNADVSERGYQAIRATVSTFIDHKTAQQQIDRILSQNEGEYYLPFAMVSFIQNCPSRESKRSTVQVTANGETQDVTLHWLEVKQLVFYDDGTGQLELSFAGADVGAKVQYQDYARFAPSNDFSVYVENCNQKYDTAVLVIEMGRFFGESTTIDIVLPANLRAGTARNLNSEATLYAKHEKLKVYTNKETASTIRIPLVVINEGAYVFESVRLTDQDGQTYYSRPITIQTQP